MHRAAAAAVAVVATPAVVAEAAEAVTTKTADQVLDREHRPRAGSLL